MGKNNHIEMREENFPECENRLRESTEQSGILSKEADDSVIIWHQEYESSEKIIFINIDRTTISITESEFFVLAKNVQNAAKSLLGIE